MQDSTESVLESVTSRSGVTYSFAHSTWHGDDGRDHHGLQIRIGRGDRPPRELKVPRWVIPALLDAIERFQERAP